MYTPLFRYTVIPVKAGIQSPRTPSHDSHSIPRPSSRPPQRVALCLLAMMYTQGVFTGALDSGFRRND